MFQMPESLGSCIRVFKFASRYDPASPHIQPRMLPESVTDNHELSLDQMVAWLEGSGWKVRRWPGGARAWKYEVSPVRSRAQIIKKRERLERSTPPELVGKLYTLDLAFDC